MGSTERPSMERLSKMLLRMARSFDAALEDEITPQKFLLLNNLLRMKKCKVNDLAQEVKLSSGATTLALNRLEKEGLILRSRDEEDRRIVWVELSEEGRSLILRLVEKRHRVWEKMLSALTPEEEQEFFRLLEKMVNQL
ncbi:MarR family winged helix-turn-helix transcriptional regulator [Polycladomyces subterraneus]|uniref:MarR family transcriptional regulator n=1 Tax=Polycladomyces subterraneus TaxID=1016997 RepID=A0ABT8IL81_9BACL|nr:MarR family transcriptional regulator [Polycladomyces subterraneus]MDN4593542.1 MarR family transcriptional regulator [Polycladomyces subterraneus]